jgi:anti-sigma28 factor (negative regulator of flagellin synthesis)
VSTEVPQEDVDQVEAIKQQIADGEITGIPTEVGAAK